MNHPSEWAKFLTNVLVVIATSFVRDTLMSIGKTLNDWYNSFLRVNYHFRPSQTVPMLMLTYGRPQSKVPFPWLSDLLVKFFTQPTTSTKSFLSKTMLDYSEDYVRSVAKSQFWYLDTDATNQTAAAGTNAGTKARGALSHGREMIETIIPLNRFSFFEELIV